MPPKRKIPSRKFAASKSRKAWPSRPFAKKRTAKPIAKPIAKPTAKPTASTTRTRKSPEPQRQPTGSLPQCFWDMGFESLPTVEELQKRYRELSLVLHPDARGTKEAFQELRVTYETALSLLQPPCPPSSTNTTATQP